MIQPVVEKAPKSKGCRASNGNQLFYYFKKNSKPSPFVKGLVFPLLIIFLKCPCAKVNVVIDMYVYVLSLNVPELYHS